MSRVFWDTMLFVYLLEDHPQFAPQVRSVLNRSYTRGDVLLTSYVALGEVMAGGKGDAAKAAQAADIIAEMGFGFLPFEGECVRLFSDLRSVVKLKAPDAIHLACAASAGVDLFLTNDQRLLTRRLYVPGIQFIADFNLPIL